eukprot:TRINITY_DN32918_c0_g1_i1.p1 TRINITY_DN32918_c0_g1~~TRINITY_DN32918_c0_g1_i1.p1  ORF type:complete len:371 (+),score=58.87 TRINITY_DN32918_c0_g1_i1:97-1113(+)
MAPAQMHVRFSVVSFAPAQVRLLVVGNRPELGEWRVEHAAVLQCQLGEDRRESEPDLHWRDVTFNEDAGCVERVSAIEYKFVELDGADVRWEEFGQVCNRQLGLDGELIGEVHLLPVQRFAEIGAREDHHTSRFFRGVKERGEISLHRVIRQIFLGSCPQQPFHIDYLKSLGVTAVMNFQTAEDCQVNCVAGIGMEQDALAIAKLYDAKGMEYIWLPAKDMSTEGRARVMPQAVFLLGGLLRCGHLVYVHCNAGVGRSVAVVCGYLSLELGLPLRYVQHIVVGARPVAFIDAEAISKARPHYEAMFGKKEKDASGDERRREEALSLIPCGGPCERRLS